MKNLPFRFRKTNYISTNGEIIFPFICKDLKVLYDYKTINNARMCVLWLLKKPERTVATLIEV